MTTLPQRDCSLVLPFVLFRFAAQFGNVILPAFPLKGAGFSAFPDLTQ